jgi:diadenylate cyclase
VGASQFLHALTPRDAIDVLAVAFVVYNLLLLIRGTRAVQVVFGILGIWALSFVARQFDLLTLEEVLRAFLVLVPVAIIVLFPNEIRRALAAFARNPLNRLASEQQIESSLQQVVLGATTLASRRIGALLVIERSQGLRDYVENGIVLDARLSLDLLLTIFNPSTPLHDGAAILQGDRIAAAACFLPLSTSPELSSKFGTRHRAGLGISEESDAIAVIVSEETGRISVALAGTLTEGVDEKTLRRMLVRYLVTDTEDRRPTA